MKLVALVTLTLTVIVATATASGADSDPFLEMKMPLCLAGDTVIHWKILHLIQQISHKRPGCHFVYTTDNWISMFTIEQHKRRLKAGNKLLEIVLIFGVGFGIVLYQ